MNASDNDWNDDDESPVLDIATLEDELRAGKTQTMAIEQKTIKDLKELVTLANKYNVRIQIDDCTLIKVSLDLGNIDISINDSDFEENVDLKNGTFRGKLRLTGLTFEGRVDLSGTSFKDHIHVEDCTFVGKAKFNKAVFEKGAVFSYCEFMEEVDFGGAWFTGKVDFSNSSFEKMVMYSNTLFKAEVDLTNTKFEGGIELSGSNLMDIIKGAACRLGHGQVSSKEKKSPQYDIPDKINRLTTKKISRRQLLRSIFPFLPQGKE